MITPILRDIEILFKPENIDDFCLCANAYITTQESIGADDFYFRVITPKRLQKILYEDKIFPGRAVFVVNEPNMDSNIALLKTEIEKFLPSCARETWEEVALAINCHLEWEYYDPECGICDFYKATMKDLESGTHPDPDFDPDKFFKEFAQRALDAGFECIE